MYGVYVFVWNLSSYDSGCEMYLKFARPSTCWQIRWTFAHNIQAHRRVYLFNASTHSECCVASTQYHFDEESHSDTNSRTNTLYQSVSRAQARVYPSRISGWRVVMCVALYASLNCTCRYNVLPVCVCTLKKGATTIIILSREHWRWEYKKWKRTDLIKACNYDTRLFQPQ